MFVTTFYLKIIVQSVQFLNHALNKLSISISNDVNFNTFKCDVTIM